jgi:Ca2+-binding RTX toxin-like protein
LHSEDYANAAAVSLTTAAANQYDFVNLAFKTPPVTNVDGSAVAGQAGLTGNAVANAGIAAAVISIVTSLANEASMNSEEYEAAAKQAVVAATIAVIVTVIVGVLSAGILTGAGAALGMLIGTAISAVGGVAIYNVVDSTWNAVEEAYDGIEDLLKGESLEDNVKQILGGIEDTAKAFSIDLVQDFSRSMVDLLADYGKNLEPGEYWMPEDLLKLVAKEDGSGNVIYALEVAGTLARARDGFDDDIVGTSGNDVLVGGDGTNVISGQAGNDHLEGRDSDDQLLGGDGNDLIEAGGGDDAISGGDGSELMLVFFAKNTRYYYTK